MRKTTIKKKAATPAKKVPAAAAAAASPQETNNGNLDFQHTPALLELVNTDKKDSLEGAESKPESSQAINEITGQLLEANKMDEQENQMVDGLDDDETDSDNMIIISSSDDNKQNEEYETELEEEAAADEDEHAEATDDDEKVANDVSSIRIDRYSKKSNFNCIFCLVTGRRQCGRRDCFCIGENRDSRANGSASCSRRRRRKAIEEKK